GQYAGAALPGGHASARRAARDWAAQRAGRAGKQSPPRDDSDRRPDPGDRSDRLPSNGTRPIKWNGRLATSGRMSIPPPVPENTQRASQPPSTGITAPLT